jgi:hypothetical protein
MILQSENHHFNTSAISHKSSDYRYKQTAVKSLFGILVCRKNLRMLKNEVNEKIKLIMKKSHQSKTYNQEARFATELTQQQIIQDNITGFLFCPRCSSVVVNEKLNSICHHCGYRFCPSCSE